MQQAGYSGRPLAAKLGLKPGMSCWWQDMPEDISNLLQGQEPGVNLLGAAVSGLECAHLFVTSRAVLQAELSRLRDLLSPAGMIWVSWPKKASKVPTDISEDVIREICLPTGLVDVKVCAVDAVWSGLKLVIRKEFRKEQEEKLTANTGTD
ncbi:hypothetical protein [Roseibium sp.]|uniref:hypothetical protein n=1 Tax=Roseibium sp. TaxID=1936156 RepID=UPI003D144EBC